MGQAWDGHGTGMGQVWDGHGTVMGQLRDGTGRGARQFCILITGRQSLTREAFYGEFDYKLF